MSTCTATDCARTARTKGFCNVHYLRHRRGLPMDAPVRIVGDPAAAFWSKVAKTDDCWIWTAALTPNGYGRLNWRGSYELAHRVSWVLAHGTPPALRVLHRCDNRRCVRPDHLFLGTDADNSLDMVKKGRAMTKLSPVDVVEIRRSYAAGEMGQTALAKRFGVRQSTIWRAIHRITATSRLSA